METYIVTVRFVQRGEERGVEHYKVQARTRALAYNAGIKLADKSRLNHPDHQRCFTVTKETKR